MMKLPGRTLLLWGIIIAAGVFALQGGQYSTVQLLQHRFRKAELERAIDSLERQIDSLQQYRKAIQTDPKVQERIAREVWGMVKEKEILYRLVDTAR